MFDPKLLLFLILLRKYGEAASVGNYSLDSTHNETYDIDQFNSSHENTDTKYRKMSESFDFSTEHNKAEVENNYWVKVNESPTESINYTKLNDKVNPIDSMGNKNTEETDIMSGPEKINAEKKPIETNGLEELNTPSAEFANATYEQSDLANYHHQLIDYISHLCCYDGSYQFIHIYVERSLATPMADTLIMQLNHCMTANILTTRYLLWAAREKVEKCCGFGVIKSVFLFYLHSQL